LGGNTIDKGESNDMEKKEFAMIAAAMKTFYPKENLFPNSQAVELWYQRFKDIDYKVAETALNLWVETEIWSPKIAQLREKCAELSSGVQEDWSEGWEQVMKAIRYMGRYREEEALKEMDEITRTVVQRLGYQELCNSENITADRANFRDVYKTLQERAKKEQNVSVLLKNASEKLKIGTKNDDFEEK
jgi:hypothetical protein